MKLLFRLATNQFSLDWHRVSDSERAVVPGSLPVTGRLKIVPYDDRLEWGDATFREGLPNAIATDTGDSVGPPLFEQTDYQIYLRATGVDDQIEIRHRDPMITRALNFQEQGRVIHGTVNFRGQIGRSLFSIHINGVKVLDFEVEVFPTKIDYETDYQDILGDVQSILTSLAYEYLRSTYQLGKISGDQRPSRLEWLILIRYIVDELDKALNHIAQRPTRGLVRRERSSKLERIRRIDSRVRSQIRRGQGKGQLIQAGDVTARERLVQRPAELTLDTMEHRWLRNQLVAVQRSLSQISRNYEGNSQASERRRGVAKGVSQLRSRISRLIRLEPIDAAEGDPPTGFASLQLVSAPGYREAYRLLMLLRMGLRLEGDLLELSTKDLEVLYEYWTYLTVVRIVHEEYGTPKGLDRLFKLNHSGLSVQLKRGSSQQVWFCAGKDRKVHVAYNPQFANQDATLIPQKPDILVRLEENGWPVIQLVADAKYRIDASEEYRRQFGSLGPPKDAINILHRYRDAILELDTTEQDTVRFKRSVVQAAALFPMNRQPNDDFRQSRLWRSLEKLGVGAIPLLPTNTVLLQDWLLAALRQGGWALADRAIANLVEERARDWRIAASEPVLVGTLRSPGTRQHLQWVKTERRYYQPRAKTQHRQTLVKQLAIYIPTGFGEPAGIRYVADVEDLEIVDRSDVRTPWPARQNEQVVLYHLGSIRPLKHPIAFVPGDSMPPQGRWTTRLGLERARTVKEVALETEPEWRLFEWLRATRQDYRIVLAPPKVQNSSNPKGRVWFCLEAGERIRFDGANGFLCQSPEGRERFVSLRELMGAKTNKLER